MNTSSPAISVCDVSYGYGDTYLLKNVNLSVFPGESVAILGESGIGKSTLLDLLLGKVKPDMGSCYILGRKPTTYLDGKY